MYVKASATNPQYFCKSFVIERSRRELIRNSAESRTSVKYLHISSELRSSENIEVNTVVCGPHALNCVRPRNDSRLKDILNFADSRILGSRHAAGSGAPRVNRAEGQAARIADRRKPLKPKGLALFQGQWRPPLGVIRVRARVRGPGHRGGTRTLRGRRRRGRLLGAVS